LHERPHGFLRTINILFRAGIDLDHQNASRFELREVELFNCEFHNFLKKLLLNLCNRKHSRMLAVTAMAGISHLIASRRSDVINQNKKRIIGPDFILK
jgi:hypothetical protein